MSHKVSGPLLDNPYAFNYVRYLLAGKQIKIKQFIQKNLIAYKCSSVLDLCCGTGDFAYACPSGVKYVGVDLNKDFTNYARKRFKNDNEKKFLEEDIIKSKTLYRKKYDAVLLISAVHHFSDKELKILLPKIKKLVNKVLIVADIIPDPPLLLQRFFTRIDRGRYVRPKKEKLAIINRYFNVVATKPIPTRSAVQLGILCELKL